MSGTQLGSVARLRVIAIALLGFCLSPLPAWAQSQGVVIVDLANIWRPNVRVIATTVRVGSTLEITARWSIWYEVVIPEALGGRGDRGLIAMSQVRLVDGSPEPPERQLGGIEVAPPPPPAEAIGGQPRAAVQESIQPAVSPQPVQATQVATAGNGMRGFIAVNGIYQVTANDFRDGMTFRENAEDGRVDTDYSIETGPSFDVAGSVAVWRRLGIGAAVSRYSRSTPVTFRAAIPHPFFFSQPRAVTGDVPGLKREELAVHLQVSGVFDVSPRVQVTVFGGPSFFQVKQGIATTYRFGSLYPYDSAFFRSAVTTNASESKIGANAGVDFAFFFSRQVGIGGTVQYAGATVELPSSGGGTQDVKAGGVRTGGGLRLRF